MIRCLPLDEVTSTVGSVFMGLTLKCAQCHDHKYDPVPQRDYYRLQAFFAPIEFLDQRVEFTDAGLKGRMEARRAANAARLLFPPLLLAGLALIGVSDFLKSMSAIGLPRLPRISLRRGSSGQPPPPMLPLTNGAPRQPGRIRMVTDMYGGTQRI